MGLIRILARLFEDNQVIEETVVIEEKKPLVGIMKPVRISKELSTFLDIAPDTLISRTQITKELCNYIREKDLQDPSDRRVIIPDQRLLDLLKTDEKLTYFSLQKFINPHILRE
jgi:upstream activation factor subunit UAF30